MSKKPKSKKSKIKVGEIWRLNHCRKGDLTLKFTSVDDEWAEAEIVKGHVSYASADNRLMQKLEGLGTPGDTITTRIEFLTLYERLAISRPHQPTTEAK